MKTKAVIIWALAVCGVLAFGQDKVKPPVITEAVKLAYFKALAEFQASSQNPQVQNYLQKQAAMNDAVQPIVLACGKDFTPSMDAQGNPVCVAKPVEVKKEK